MWNVEKIKKKNLKAFEYKEQYKEQDKELFNKCFVC